MQNKKAFIVSYYDVVDKSISFKGRVLSDIRIGDKLLYITNLNETLVIKEYFVQKILAYKKEFDYICEGMTCEIIVNGEKSEFNEDCLLYLEQL